MINYKKIGIASQRGELLKLRAVCLNAARSTAPVDTGNLKMNGIYSIATKNGFKIVWDKAFAYYMSFVNEGKSSGDPLAGKRFSNINFVGRGIANVVAVAETWKNRDERSQLYDALRKKDYQLRNLVNKKIEQLDYRDGKNVERLKARMRKNASYVSEKIKDGDVSFMPNENVVLGYSDIVYNKNKQTSRSYEVFDFTDIDFAERGSE